MINVFINYEEKYTSKYIKINILDIDVAEIASHLTLFDVLPALVLHGQGQEHAECAHT